MRRLSICLVVISTNRFGRGIYQGITDFLSEKIENFELVITHDKSLLQTQRSIDGIIAMATTAAAVRIVKACGVPVVNVSSYLEPDPSELPAVIADSEQAGHMAAEHLINCRFCHFGYHGHTPGHAFAMYRKGFEKTLAVAGFSCHEHISYLGSHSALSSADAADKEKLKKWLANLPKPVGIFCGLDRDALEISYLCGELGLRVGKDVGIVGYGNDEFFCQTRHPYLSSVENNPARIGYEAAKLLVDLIHGGRPPGKPIRVAPAGVIARESSRIVLAEDPHVDMALRYIRSHLDQPSLIREVFKTVPMSRRTLERRFQNCIGHTVVEAIQLMKIDRIKHLLDTTSMKLHEISEACGFSDTPYMATLFRKKVGVTPSKYRARFQCDSTKAASDKKTATGDGFIN